MKNIKVPEGMLAAVDEAIGEARMSKASRSATAEGNPELWPSEIVQISVEAALGWLSPALEKSISEVLYDCCHSLSQPSMYEYTNGQRLEYIRKHVLTEVRNLLLVPEPSPAVTRIKQALQGQTITAGDAVELMDAVQRCTSPEPGPSLDDQRRTDLMRNGYTSDYVETPTTDREAEIRREARKRTLDEMEAFSREEYIESGVGVDVQRIYFRVVQEHERRRKTDGTRQA